MLCMVLTLEFPARDLAINPALVPLLPKHLAGRGFQSRGNRHRQ